MFIIIDESRGIVLMDTLYNNNKESALSEIYILFGGDLWFEEFLIDEPTLEFGIR